MTMSGRPPSVDACSLKSTCRRDGLSDTVEGFLQRDDFIARRRTGADLRGGLAFRGHNRRA
jgi:hypothetical protein